VVLGLTRADPGRFADNGGHGWLGIFSPLVCCTSRMRASAW
jgi:hypothetical protein